MKKKLLTLSLTIGILSAHSAMACTTGQQGIGYTNASTGTATVTITAQNTSQNIYSNVTVNGQNSYYEFCWTSTSDTYMISQTISGSSSYINFTSQDFVNSNYFINVSSNQTSPSWTAMFA